MYDRQEHKEVARAIACNVKGLHEATVVGHQEHNQTSVIG
jgi:hypothetical protein